MVLSMSLTRKGWLLLALLFTSQVYAVTCDDGGESFYQTNSEGQLFIINLTGGFTASNVTTSQNYPNTRQATCHPNAGLGTSHLFHWPINVCTAPLQYGPTHPDADANGCYDPNAGLPSASCNQQEIIDIITGTAGMPNEPDASYLKAPIAAEVFFGDAIDLTDVTDYVCQTIPGYTDLSGEEPLECRWGQRVRQELSDDFELIQISFVTGITDTEISNDLLCGTQESSTQSFDISQYGQETEITTTDPDTGTILTEKSACYTTSSYQAGNTKTCLICENSTTTNGPGPGTLNITQQCETKAGDHTLSQDGSSGTGTVDGSGNFVTGSGGAGTAGTAGTTPSGAAQTTDASNQDVVNALGDLATSLDNLEPGQGCDDPDGCEDFAEIIENYDGTTFDAGVSTAIDSLTTQFTTEETDLTSVSTNPESLVGVGVQSGQIENIVDVFPTGSCQNMSLEFFPGHQNVLLECDDMSFIQSLLNLAMLLATIAYLRSVWMRPATVT